MSGTYIKPFDLFERMEDIKTGKLSVQPGQWVRVNSQLARFAGVSNGRVNLAFPKKGQSGQLEKVKFEDFAELRRVLTGKQKAVAV